jgi:3-methylfumaryl-CoA hydratase
MSSNPSLADVGFAPEATVDLSVDQIGRLAALLDEAPPEVGDPIPLLWHWSCFTPTARTAELGPDGHPQPGTALARFPRRMWGAGNVTMVRPLLAGTATLRRSALLDSREVAGRHGDLLIVRVEHRYSQLGDERLREEQTVVYRESGPPILLPEGDATPPEGAGWQRMLIADTRLLFRYSAASFNSHRIHYDLPYAKRVEGYPALVVQGPLSAQLLASAAADHAGSALQSFSFKATAPLFAGLEFTMAGTLRGNAGSATITRNDGAIAVECEYAVGC